MTYEYAIRPYDRTPQGNIPVTYNIEADSDLKAFCDIFFAYDYSESADNEELIGILIDEGLLEKKCSEAEALRILADYQNSQLDPGDQFIFYIKNLDTNKFIYENNYCSVEDWINSLQGDSREFIKDVVADFDDKFSPLGEYFAKQLIRLKKKLWGTDGSYSEFYDDVEDEPSIQRNVILRFLASLAFTGSIEDSIADLSLNRRSFKKVKDKCAEILGDAFDVKEWEDAWKLAAADIKAAAEARRPEQLRKAEIEALKGPDFGTIIAANYEYGTREYYLAVQAKEREFEKEVITALEEGRMFKPTTTYELEQALQIIAWEVTKHGKHYNFDQIDISEIKSLRGVFWGVRKSPAAEKALQDMDITGWDTSNVVDMGELFKFCSLFNQDISGWDTSKVKYMDGMFDGASSFNQDIGSWDVSNVVDMSWMFCNAESFNADINRWDVSNVTNMNSMFRDALSFTHDLPNWNVQENCDTRDMFLKLSRNELGYVYGRGADGNWRRDPNPHKVGNRMIEKIQERTKFSQDIRRILNHY